MSTIEIQVYVRIRGEGGRLVGDACSGIATHPGVVGRKQREILAADVVSYAMNQIKEHLVAESK